MGFRMSWIATPLTERERVFKTFGVEPCGDAEDELAADYTYAETPDGWLILVHNKFRGDVRDVLAGLSDNGCAYGFEITEVVNFSEAVAFDHGRLVWAVTRDADAGDALIIEGEPPDLFAEIRQRLEAEQAADPDTDILIDAPVELLQKLIGYRMDQESGLSWTALRGGTDAGGREPTTAARRPGSGIWAFLASFFRR